jgi:hypothetical protein
MRILVVVAIVITVGALGVWQASGGDFYTKFEVVREVTQPLDPSDPLVAAGFYDTGSTTVVRERQFRLGLLPTPSRLLDKHALSVTTIISPVWAVAAVAALVRRKRKSPG